MKTKNSLLGDEEKLAKVNFILKEKRMLNGERNTGERNLNLSVCVPQMKTTSILNPS